MRPGNVVDVLVNWVAEYIAFSSYYLLTRTLFIYLLA